MLIGNIDMPSTHKAYLHSRRFDISFKSQYFTWFCKTCYMFEVIKQVLMISCIWRISLNQTPIKLLYIWIHINFVGFQKNLMDFLRSISIRNRNHNPYIISLFEKNKFHHVRFSRNPQVYFYKWLKNVYAFSQMIKRDNSCKT